MSRLRISLTNRMNFPIPGHRTALTFQYKIYGSESTGKVHDVNDIVVKRHTCFWLLAVSWHLEYHKVVHRCVWGVEGSSVTVSVHVYCWVWRWKNIENWSTWRCCGRECVPVFSHLRVRVRCGSRIYEMGVQIRCEGRHRTPATPSGSAPACGADWQHVKVFEAHLLPALRDTLYSA